jgi:hypothetical protein
MMRSSGPQSKYQRIRLWPLARTVLFIFPLLLGGLPGSRTAAAQAGIGDLQHEYQFGDRITFRAAVQGDSPAVDALLFIQVEGENGTRKVQVAPDADGGLLISHDAAAQPVRAFSTVTYWFEASLQSGEKVTSEKASFLYEDNRFSWQVREAAPFRVHWYDGEADFAQNILDISAAGLKGVQNLLPLERLELVDIYVYSTASEMQKTLNLGSQNWVVAGHADPDLGVMVVVLPAGPDQRLLMEQRIPHEMMHIMMYHTLGDDYANLPVWLSEGLASSAELYPNPDYLILLNGAQENGKLISIASLCKTFPRDASTALLAYAQAASFTRYLHQQYGTSGLEKLLEAYRDGMDCERGVQTVTGQELSQLEKSWRRDVFGENLLLTAVITLSPWLVLLFTVLAVPIGLTLVGLRKRPARQVDRQTAE